MENKKVGIFTVHWAINYGTVFQCIGLNKVIKKLGYDVETLNYNPWGSGYSLKYFLSKRPSKGIPRYRAFKAINKFYASHIRLTRPILGLQSMNGNTPFEDTYVVGSDIVWDRKIVEDYLDQFLLSFTPEQSRRISYAASIGGGAQMFQMKIIIYLSKTCSVSLLFPLEKNKVFLLFKN